MRAGDWFKEAFQEFKKDPLGCLLILLIYSVITFSTRMIPKLGVVFETLLHPLLIGGLMIGWNRLRIQGEVRAGDVFYGFQNKAKELFTIGLLALPILGSIVAVMVTLFFLTTRLERFDAAAMATAMTDPLFIFGLVVVALIITCYLILMLFAPLLVVFKDYKPWQAMKESANACMKHWWPLTVYSLWAVLWFFVALIPLGLGLLVFVPVASISFLKAYGAIFGHPTQLAKTEP
ncbi:DUF975 family protein [bacterium]|jgi:hypothetical protein|nr:DUF975 family protein [bacterium]